MSGNSTSIQSFTHMPVDLCTHMSTCTRSHMPRNVSVHMSVHMSPRITSDVYPELPTSEIFCRHVDNFTGIAADTPADIRAGMPLADMPTNMPAIMPSGEF